MFCSDLKKNGSIWCFFASISTRRNRSFVCLFQSNGRAFRHTNWKAFLWIPTHNYEFRCIMKKNKLLLWKEMGEICPVKLKLSSTRSRMTKMVFGSLYSKYAYTCTISFCFVLLDENFWTEKYPHEISEFQLM